MNTSRFAKLPPELRELVFEFALTEPEPIRIEISHENRRLRRISTSEWANNAWNQEPIAQPWIRYPHTLALTSTCHQIRVESLPVLLRSNEFTFHIFNEFRYGNDTTHYDPTWLQSAYQAFTALITNLGKRSENLKNISIDLGNFRFHQEGFATQMAAWIREFQRADARCMRGAGFLLQVDIWQQDSGCTLDLRNNRQAIKNEAKDALQNVSDELAGTMDRVVVMWRISDIMESLDDLLAALGEDAK